VSHIPLLVRRTLGTIVGWSFLPVSKKWYVVWLVDGLYMLIPSCLLRGVPLIVDKSPYIIKMTGEGLACKKLCIKKSFWYVVNIFSMVAIIIACYNSSHSGLEELKRDGQEIGSIPIIWLVVWNMFFP